MRQLFIIAIATTLFVACKDKKGTDNTTDAGTTTTNTTTNTTNTTGWADTTRTGFINNCITESKGKMNEDQAREYCNCMLGKIEAKYPDASTASSLTMQEMQSMAQDCVK